MKSRFCWGVTTVVIAFLYIPIILLVIHSFNASRFGGEWGGFTLKWYEKLFQDRALLEAFLNSLIVALSSACCSTILGTMAAFAIHRFHSPLQKVHYGLIYLPLIIPDVLMGIGLLLFFVALHVKLGLFTIFLAHTTFCLSYVTMMMVAKLQHFDFSLVEAARDLGADTPQVVRRILLPLLAPGITAALLLAFTLSIDDFVITFFVAGEGATTLPLYIYAMMKFGSTPIINALSSLTLLVTLTLLLLYQTVAKEGEEVV